MLNSLLILINTSRLIPGAGGFFPVDFFSSRVYKYIVVVLGLIGAFKIYKWTRFLISKWPKRPAAAKSRPAKPAGSSSQSKRSSAHGSGNVSNNAGYKRNASSKKTPTESSEAPRHKFTFKPPVTPNPECAFKQRVNELENSESLIGVATAAATAASVFLDHKRKKRCCEKCYSGCKSEPQTAAQ
jgi:hypothetical protein